MAIGSKEQTGSTLNRLYAHLVYERVSRWCCKNPKSRPTSFILGNNVKPTEWDVVDTDADVSSWPTFSVKSPYAWFDPRRYDPRKRLMREAVVLSTSATDLFEQQSEDGGVLAVAFTVGKLGETAVVAGLLQDASVHEGQIRVGLRAGLIGRAAMIGLVQHDGVFKAARQGAELLPDGPFTCQEVVDSGGTVQ